jgi:putative transposase
MRCIGCGSTAVSERSEQTTRGYRRFRCRDCGKQFNERSESLLNRTQYPSDVIALVVFWRLPAWCMDWRVGAGKLSGVGGRPLS